MFSNRLALEKAGGLWPALAYLSQEESSRNSVERIPDPSVLEMAQA
jgi:hypothetical protein